MIRALRAPAACVALLAVASGASRAAATEADGSNHAAAASSTEPLVLLVQGDALLASRPNLAEDPRAEVWGVLYRITRRDLVRLDATEGVPWWRYRSLWLEAEDVSGDLLRAVTYIAQGDKHDRRPSLRYLTLLREGARAHGWGVGAAERFVSSRVTSTSVRC